MLVLGQDFKIRLHFLDIRLGQAGHVKVKQVAQVDIDLHATLHSQCQHLAFVEAGTVGFDRQLL